MTGFLFLNVTFKKMFKTLPKTQKPFPLTLDSEKFAASYIVAHKDKTSDLTEVIKLVMPALKHWDDCLKNNNYSSDINMLTLCRLLSNKPAKAITMIRNWVVETNKVSSTIDELIFLFIKRARKIKYLPRAKAPVMIEYVVARDLKLALKEEIKKSWIKTTCRLGYSAKNNLQLEEKMYDKLPDYYALNIIRESFWLYYLCTLIYQGYTSIERSNLTQIKRQNLYREEKQLWQLLKSKL
jgi:hypothetical protein